jgi:catechol 2,3-dioxygenase-like lactoylglutathione lyase family enzyme
MIDRFHHLYIEPVDYDASLAFYRDVLGWTVTEDWHAEGGNRGAVLSGGGMKVVLAERNGAAPPADASGSRPSIHLDIHDIDARFRALPKGAHVVSEPEPTHWGTRWFVVRDPDGNRIAFEEVHGKGA